MKKIRLLSDICRTAAILAASLIVCGSAVAAPATVELTMEEAVKMALANNPTGKIAVFEQEAAQGALTSARSGLGPTFSGTHTDQRSLTSSSSNSSSGQNTNYASDRYNNSFMLNWVLWSGNKVQGQITQANLNLDSSRWGVEAARQQLKYDATDAFINVMAARDSVKLNEESVDRLAQYLSDVRLQFDVGVVARVDVLRSEVELAKAKQTLIEARNTYDLAMAKLNNVIGLPLATVLRIKENLEFASYAEPLENCVDAALRQRPEISQYENDLKIAQAEITVARAGYLPTVTAAYQFGWYDTSFPGANNYNWTAYLSTSWTFLDSGLTAGKVKQALAGYRKAREQLRQMSDTVQLDVRSTYLSMKAAAQSIETSSASVGLAEEDYKIKVIRYQSGVGTNLDVLDAQVALTTAKNNYLKAMYDYNNYRAKLDKAMGVPVR